MIIKFTAKLNRSHEQPSPSEVHILLDSELLDAAFAAMKGNSFIESVRINKTNFEDLLFFAENGQKLDVGCDELMRWRDTCIDVLPDGRVWFLMESSFVMYRETVDDSFLVRLTVSVDGYEKTSLHVVIGGACPEKVARAALLAECHNDDATFPHWDECEDDTMSYSVQDITPLCLSEQMILGTYIPVIDLSKQTEMDFPVYGQEEE